MGALSLVAADARAARVDGAASDGSEQRRGWCMARPFLEQVRARTTLLHRQFWLRGGTLLVSVNELYEYVLNRLALIVCLSTLFSGLRALPNRRNSYTCVPSEEHAVSSSDYE